MGLHLVRTPKTNRPEIVTPACSRKKFFVSQASLRWLLLLFSGSVIASPTRLLGVCFYISVTIRQVRPASFCLYPLSINSYFVGA